jgi:ubiquinone/menaquinone biosynthesis C-methylase UbiE
MLAREYARHRRVHPEVVKGLISDGAVSRASHVLEVGSGTGNYIIALEQATGCKARGIEPSAAMLAVAQGRASRVHFAQGSAERLVHSPPDLDLIFSVDVIHHAGDRPAYFRQAYQALNKGGRVCTVTDSEDIIRNRSPLSFYFPETVQQELQRYPRIDDLRQMMEDAGFRGLQERVVEFVSTLSDIQMYRDKAFSSLHLISEEAFAAGIRRMEHDLADGPIPYISRYLLQWGTA